MLISTLECKITCECVSKHKYMRRHVLRLEKHVMFEYNLKIYIYLCVMYLLWQFRNMSLYMREYVCVKA